VSTVHAHDHQGSAAAGRKLRKSVPSQGGADGGGVGQWAAATPSGRAGMGAAPEQSRRITWLEGAVWNANTEIKWN
jgi:hypothetical protein